MLMSPPFSFSENCADIGISTRRTNMFVLLLVMLMLMLQFGLCLRPSENQAIKPRHVQTLVIFCSQPPYDSTMSISRSASEDRAKTNLGVSQNHRINNTCNWFQLNS